MFAGARTLAGRQFSAHIFILGKDEKKNNRNDTVAFINEYSEVWCQKSQTCEPNPTKPINYFYEPLAVF